MEVYCEECEYETDQNMNLRSSIMKKVNTEDKIRCLYHSSNPSELKEHQIRSYL